MNNELIANRSEIIFLYDIKNANPNGDPLDENKPRIDEETGKNLVTDVRLKRTIRDYLFNFKNEEIFVKEVRDDQGYIQDAKARANDFLRGKEAKDIEEAKKLIREEILTTCIDVRMFGATIPVSFGKSDSSITYTGPVQFTMGVSLHPVKLQFIKGTGAFASGPGKTQATFREEYILPYSLIQFYGIINENAAKITRLTEQDVELLMDGIWNGTKNLISRSKAGQVPRLLMQIIYKEHNYHIGDLDSKLKLVSEKRGEEIRGTEDYTVDVGDFLEIISGHKDEIKEVKYKHDVSLKLSYEGRIVAINELLSRAGVEAKQISF
ncbi:type I-B CRISPR-associated protein Cas7/Csh2 [bacterium]|nr:type I-B CRISPR-associated protein Cas7/Csh2 [bacterium]